MQLSVVIPVFNEEKRIEESMRRVEAFMSLKVWEWECIISSDGSKDRTDEVVKASLKARQDQRFKLMTSEKNKGKGATVRRAVLAAQGDYILMTDADLSAPIKEVDKLIQALEEGFDVAIGSRGIREKEGDVQQSFMRYLFGRVFNGFVQLFVLRGFLDTQCGFKCFKKEAAKRLFEAQKLDGFSFDVEILYLAGKMGLKVKEVPVMWREAAGSRVRLLRDSIAMLKELLKIRRLHA